MDYDILSKTFRQPTSIVDLPLLAAWQLEFYKAVYRCTPNTFVTSADVGAIFGSAGFIDFTLRHEEQFWGFELLQEGKELQDHIDRFAPDGQYADVELSDYCLVDFRGMEAIERRPKLRFKMM